MFSTCPWLGLHCQPSAHQQHMAATVEQKVHRLIQSVTLVKCDEYGEAGAFSDAFIILTH